MVIFLKKFVGQKHVDLVFFVGWVKGEVVFLEGGHETLDNLVGPAFMFPTLACLLPEAVGVDGLGEFNGIVVVAPEEKNTGVIGGEHGWALTTG